MPTADQQASLLFFSAEELEALQDAELQTAGQRWQQQVCVYMGKGYDCVVCVDGDRQAHTLPIQINAHHIVPRSAMHMRNTSPVESQSL
mmetsp:Transcript_24831/g.44235  ORF Transcript_24831/g.44235 Transcript_24831/m.44235 type:complete len:89 (+) Transcript_24831:294-560(+)